jgi:hypothetical protein
MIESTKSTKRLVWRWGFWALGVAVLASALMAGIETVRADEAPTLHLYVVDSSSDCEHPSWHDPLFEEWLDAGVAPGPNVRR